MSSSGSRLRLVEAEVAQIWEVSEAISQGVVPGSAEKKSFLILTCVFRLMRKKQNVGEGGPPDVNSQPTKRDVLLDFRLPWQYRDLCKLL